MLALIRALCWRLMHLISWRKSEALLDHELEFHLEMEIEENLRQGMSKDEARRRALVALGGLQQTKESYLDVQQIRWLREFWQDLRYAGRSMHKNPGFSVTAILTLAVCIGATTSIFSIVDGTLYRPFPYKNPDRIVRIMNRDPKDGRRSTIMPKDALVRFQQAETLESVAASNMWQFPPILTFRGGEFAETIQGANVTAGYLHLLGVQPLLGRGFSPEDEAAAAPVAILTHALWRRSFGSDVSIIGKTIAFQEESRTIIGVLPPEFRFPAETPGRSAEILLPFPAKWQMPYCTLIGRLKPNISLSEAQAEAYVINAHLPYGNMPTHTVFISPLNRIEYVDPTTLLSLFGAAIFLVLIACANVANLQIARSVTRRRELAVRAAIGAGRGRLLRQLMAESLFLSGIGGFLGVLLAYGTLDLFLAKLPVFFRPMAMDVVIDHRVVAFSAGLTIVVGMLFGLVPALQGSAPNLTEGLKPAEGRAFHFWGRWKIRGSLIVVEVGLALVLLMGSGLLLNSFVRLQRIDLGFDPANIRIATPIGLRNTNLERLPRLCDEIVMRLRTATAVQSAAVVEERPFEDSMKVSGDVNTFRVSSGYFETLGVPCLWGRLFTRQDEQGPPTVAVINESMWKRSFPGQNPLGRTVTAENASTLQIIGIVPDFRWRELQEAAKPAVYLPYNLDKGSRTILFRVAPGSEGAPPQIKAILNGILPLKIVKLEDQLADSISSPRFYTLLMGLFAAIGLVLTAVGISGVTTQSVARRRHEIGVRLALGAERWQVVAMVVRQVILPVTIGLAMGIAGALALTRVFAALLFEIKPGDPITFVSVSVLSVVVALLSSYIPARRASRIDPMGTLRCE